MPWPSSPTIDQTYQPDPPDGSTYVYRGDGKWDVQIPPAAATLADYYTKTEEDAAHGALEDYADAAVAVLEAAAAAAYIPLTQKSTNNGVASLNSSGKVPTSELSLVKGDVGLGNVDNTSDANKPVSTAAQTALDLKAAIAGQTFTGDVIVDKTGNAELKSKGTTTAYVTADSPVTTNAGWRLSRGGSKRFEVRLSTEAESGANAGSHINLYAFEDDGVTQLFIGQIVRATRVLSFGVAPKVGTDVIWHAGNDGPASGLNADLLDNFHASSFVRTINTVSPDGSGNVALTVAGIGGVALSSVVTAGTGSQTAPSGSTYWNGSATPTTSDRRRIDTATVSHTATATGRRLRVTYQANFVPSSDVTINNVTLGLALFRDSDANAIDWVHISPGHRANGTDIYSTPDSVHASFIVTAPDASSHTYHVAVISRSSGAVIDVGDLSRRHLSIQEYAA